MTTYSHKSKNIAKTWGLMIGFFIFVIIVGFVFAQAFGNPYILYIAVTLAVVMNVVSYWKSDKIVLAMTKAKPIELATDELKAKILSHIETLGMSPDHVERRLSAYGAETIDDLTLQDAQTIFKKLEAVIASKQTTQGGSHA